MIRESFQLTATDTDVLAAPARLSAIPYNGTLTFELTALHSDNTNNFEVTLQLPDGSTPFENLRLPANGSSTTDAVMDTDTQVTFSFPASQGGHFLLSATETGTTNALIYVTLTP